MGFVSALKSLSSTENEDVLITPNDEIPSELYGKESFPIYIVLSPDRLDVLLRENLPTKWKSKLDDFVFVTWLGYNIEPILRPFGLPRETSSQLLPTMTIPQPPYVPEELAVQYGDGAWSMESVATGKWKKVIAARLDPVHCRTVFYRDYRRAMWEKIVMYAVFNIVGAVREERTTFQDVALYYANEASEMLWQMSALLRGSLAITLTYGFEERMLTFAETRGKDMVCTLGTFPYTNGAIWEISKQGLERGFGDPAPLHTQYLIYAVRDKGLLNLDLPKAQREQKVSIMRKGILRADGKI